MGWFSDDHKQANQEIYGSEQHKSSWSHELIGGAAAFEAMKAYEDHERKEGKPPSHQFAKELMAGFAGAEVDKLFETKGLDAWDREKAKRHAQEEARRGYEERFEQ